MPLPYSEACCLQFKPSKIYLHPLTWPDTVHPLLFCWLGLQPYFSSFDEFQRRGHAGSHIKFLHLIFFCLGLYISDSSDKFFIFNFLNKQPVFPPYTWFPFSSFSWTRLLHCSFTFNTLTLLCFYQYFLIIVYLNVGVKDS